MKRSTTLSIALLATVLAAGPASAQRLPGAAPVRPGTSNRPVPELEGVEIVEKLGDHIPRQLMFKDETGAPVAIGSLLDGERPVLLLFYYSRCPMLCSVQLGDLIDVLNKSRWVVGDKFRIISVSLDPTETYKTAFETKEGYLDRYKAPDVKVSERFKDHGDVDSRTAIAQSWTFLVGEEKNIRALADAVGFHYNFIPDKREYAHPTAIIVLDANGQVVSYLHGLTWEPEDLNSRVVKAALGQPTESTAQFVFSCFHFTEPAGFTAIAFKAMRYGGFLFLILLVGGLILLHRRKKTRSGNS